MKERFEERKVHGQLREAFGICIQLDQEKGLHDSPHLRHHEAEEKRKQEEGDAYEPLMWGVHPSSHTTPSSSGERIKLIRELLIIIINTSAGGRGSGEAGGRSRSSSIKTSLLLLLRMVQTPHHACILDMAFILIMNLNNSAFSDEEDLARNCPGSTEADHE